MRPMVPVLLLSCLLVGACEQKTPSTISMDSTRSQTTALLPPIDEAMIIEPQFSIDSLYSGLNYPKSARQVDGKFTVFVQVLIDTNGTPGKARIVKSDNQIFNQAAIDAVKKTRFTPAYHKETGEPVRVWITIPIDFSTP